MVCSVRWRSCCVYPLIDLLCWWKKKGMARFLEIRGEKNNESGEILFKFPTWKGQWPTAKSIMSLTRLERKRETAFTFLNFQMVFVAIPKPVDADVVTNLLPSRNDPNLISSKGLLIKEEPQIQRRMQFGDKVQQFVVDFQFDADFNFERGFDDMHGAFGSDAFGIEDMT